MPYDADGNYIASEYGQTTPADIGGSVEYQEDSPAYENVPTYGQTPANETNTLPADSLYTYLNESSSAPNYSSFGRSDNLALSDAAGDSSDTSFVGTIKDLIKSFDSASPQVKSSTIALGGSFLQGLFASKWKAKESKNASKMADASMIRAQTDATTQAEKTAQLARSQVSGLKFKPPGLIYSNLLAERQKRAGFTGAS